MALLISAVSPGQLRPFLVVMVFGALVGMFGHIIKSRTLILLGITVVGGVSAYFFISGTLGS